MRYRQLPRLDLRTNASPETERVQVFGRFELHAAIHQQAAFGELKVNDRLFVADLRLNLLRLGLSEARMMTWDSDESH